MAAAEFETHFLNMSDGAMSGDEVMDWAISGAEILKELKENVVGNKGRRGALLKCLGLNKKEWASKWEMVVTVAMLSDPVTPAHPIFAGMTTAEIDVIQIVAQTTRRLDVECNGFGAFLHQPPGSTRRLTTCSHLLLDMIVDFQTRSNGFFVQLLGYPAPHMHMVTGLGARRTPRHPQQASKTLVEQLDEPTAAQGLPTAIQPRAVGDGRETVKGAMGGGRRSSRLAIAQSQEDIAGSVGLNNDAYCSSTKRATKTAPKGRRVASKKTRQSSDAVIFADELSDSDSDGPDSIPATRPLGEYYQETITQASELRRVEMRYKQACEHWQATNDHLREERDHLSLEKERWRAKYRVEDLTAQVGSGRNADIPVDQAPSEQIKVSSPVPKTSMSAHAAKRAAQIARLHSADAGVWETIAADAAAWDLMVARRGGGGGEWDALADLDTA